MAYRARMTVENRAKQFAPFSAITGLDRAVDQKLREANRVEKRELSEERAAELDEKLRTLRRGMRVSLAYYANREYCSLSGLVERIEPEEGFLKIGNERIPFADLSDVFLPQPLPFSPECATLFPGDEA